MLWNSDARATNSEREGSMRTTFAIRPVSNLKRTWSVRFDPLGPERVDQFATLYRANSEQHPDIKEPPPLLVAYNGVVVDGHQRFEGAKLAGVTCLPCDVLPPHVPVFEQKIIAFAFNRHSGSMPFKHIDLVFQTFEMLDDYSPEEIIVWGEENGVPRSEIASCVERLANCGMSWCRCVRRCVICGSGSLLLLPLRLRVEAQRTRSEPGRRRPRSCSLGSHDRGPGVARFVRRSATRSSFSLSGSLFYCGSEVTILTSAAIAAERFTRGSALQMPVLLDSR
jgi:hypothetical protein